MAFSDIIDRASLVLDQTLLNFNVKLISQTQNYSYNHIILTFQLWVSTLVVRVSDSNLLILQLRLDNMVKDTIIHADFEKLIPIDEAVSNIELMIAMDDALAKVNKKLAGVPKSVLQMLIAFRKEPYKEDFEKL